MLKALADPTRRAIFERLITAQESTVSELTRRAGVSQPAVSQHLAALRRAGLVVERRAGREVHYRADAAGLRPITDWVARQESFWRRGLDRLQTLLEEMDR